jgi:hypothetical protein
MTEKLFFSPVLSKQSSYNLASVALLAITSIGMIPGASAQESWAIELGEYPKCTSCHTSQPGSGDTVKPAAKQAYNNGELNGLKEYLKIFNANSKPVLLPINGQWNVQVGEIPLTIPLSVKDKEADNFVMQLSNASQPVAPKGYSFSKPYTLASNQLPTVNFIWKPTTAQKNKNYTASFSANETTATGSKQLSNIVTANIFVWAARPVSAKYIINQFMVDNAKWAANKLTLTGRIAFKPKISAPIKAAALNALRLRLKSNAGAVVGIPMPIKPNTLGVWTSTMPLTAAQVPCLIKAEYEGLTVASTVKPVPSTCLK